MEWRNTKIGYVPGSSAMVWSVWWSFNRALLEDLEAEPLQLCVLGQQTQAKQEFVLALSTVEGNFIPPPTSRFLSRNLSRMPSCESINCPLTDPTLNPGLAKVKDVDRKTKGGKLADKTIGPFILEKVKLSIDENLLDKPPVSEMILQEALARVQSPTKPKKLELKVHDVNESFQVENGVCSEEVLYDAFLVSIGSRYIRQSDLEITKWCSEFHRRRSILVYTNLSNDMKKNTHDDLGEDTESHSKIKSYYRQKLYKYKLSDISLFIVDAHSQDYDYPELLRILFKWDKRKAHRRKHAVVKIEKEVISGRLGEYRKYSMVPAILCGLLTGLPPQGFPIGPILSDVAIGVLRHAWYPSTIGMPTETPTLNGLDSLETTEAKLLHIAAYTPCTLLYMAQYTSSLVFHDSWPTVHSVVCGLTAGLAYVSAQSILTQSLDKLQDDAFHCINQSVGDST